MDVIQLTSDQCLTCTKKIVPPEKPICELCLQQMTNRFNNKSKELQLIEKQNMYDFQQLHSFVKKNQHLLGNRSEKEKEQDEEVQKLEQELKELDDAVEQVQGSSAIEEWLDARRQNDEKVKQIQRQHVLLQQILVKNNEQLQQQRRLKTKMMSFLNKKLIHQIYEIEQQDGNYYVNKDLVDHNNSWRLWQMLELFQTQFPDFESISFNLNKMTVIIKNIQYKILNETKQQTNQNLQLLSLQIYRFSYFLNKSPFNFPYKLVRQNSQIVSIQNCKFNKETNFQELLKYTMVNYSYLMNLVFVTFIRRLQQLQKQ